MAFLLDRLIPSSLQVLVNMTEYLREDRYGKWLKVEGNGEEAKFWCWVCHQYTGAKDLLGTSKTVPASEEKLAIHDKHAEHINAFKIQTSPGFVESQRNNPTSAYGYPGGRGGHEHAAVHIVAD